MAIEVLQYPSDQNSPATTMGLKADLNHEQKVTIVSLHKTNWSIRTIAAIIQKSKLAEGAFLQVYRSGGHVPNAAVETKTSATKRRALVQEVSKGNRCQEDQHWAETPN